MQASGRSRSPHRQIHMFGEAGLQDAETATRQFLAAALQLQHGGCSIPAEVLRKCKDLLDSTCSKPKDLLDSTCSKPKDLLDSACSKFLEVSQLEMFVLCDDWAELLDSRTLCQLSATSRRLSDSFHSLVKDHQATFHSVLATPEYCAQDLISVQSWQHHSSFLVHILNGNMDAVKFIVQLGVDVNQVERGQELSRSGGGCDLCDNNESSLLEYTFWEVSCIMANSRSPSARRLQIRDLLSSHGGHSSRSLRTKRWLVRHLNGHGEPGCWGSRCRLAETGIDDSDPDSSDSS